MRGWAVTVAVVLAGCASVVEPVDEAAAQDLPMDVHLVGEPPGAFLPAAGSLGYDEQVSFQGACRGACRLVVSPAHVDREGSWLDVRFTWDGTATTGFDVRVEDLEGRPLAADVRRGFDGVRAVVWAPAEGPHVFFLEGAGDVAGLARLRAVDLSAVPGDDLLPNLVTLTPIGLQVAACKLEEAVEEDAKRCLRLGNSVGNVGDGPLEVHLDFPNGALSAAGQGRFMQRIYHAAGHRDVEASGAEFHLAHGHFHYAGLAHFELHAVQEGLREGQVAVGHKRGFCFLDWGPMDVPEAPPEQERHAEQNCLVPATGGWSMGISRGWYDYYWAELADQYIDIEGVPDGTYELVSVADGAGTLVETDESDNKASLLIHLAGDQVRVLEERALYDNPEGP